MRSILPGLFLLSPFLSSCVVVPQTVATYDTHCHVVTRHVVLETVQVAAIQHCANQGCAALLVAGAVGVGASAIVSGSIAVVGNIVYWAEEHGDCRPDEVPGTPPASAAPAASASIA
jgi:hypothetical protein